ncbi:MAG: hypothetical protein WC928_03780 [Patescibacteria group bacterium]|jgi:hypothetical protein
MPNQENNLNSSSPKEITWEIEPLTKHQKDKRWYIIASIIALALIIYALIDKNYFFALIIIIASGLIVFYDNEPIRKINFTIKYDGVEMGKNFFSFESMSNFYIIYRPKEEVKKLYFEFKNPLKHRLSIQLYDQDPIIIRNYLLQYLNEDLEKENEPLSEGLAKMFRL